MRRLYTSLYAAAIPLILLRLLLRSVKAPAYAKRWDERFACKTPKVKPGGIWIHAVSVGETNAAVPLVKALQKQYPDQTITMTTTTPTGSLQVKKSFGESVAHVYTPYDLPVLVSRFLDAVEPRCLIIMETEWWPNILNACSERQIPVLLANARLSERSKKKYARFPAMTTRLLSQITHIASQNKTDAQRFIELGIDAKKITVTGSIKFDITIPDELHAKANALRTAWGADRPVWIVASTHEGEDELILNVFKTIRESLPETLLVLVPRHPERFSKVATLCEKQGFETVTRSSGKKCKPSTAIFVGDTMGELNLFYAASDVAFVAGSFKPIGGHNLLEPAALGIPSVTGPHVFNFTEITNLLVNAGAVKQVQTPDALAKITVELLTQKDLRDTMATKGLAVIASNRGSLTKHLSCLEGLIQ